jgi:hypothetical protein
MELRFLGGPLNGIASDLGAPVPERVRLNLPAMMGGPGRAVYDLFVDRDGAFYSFSGWDGDVYDAMGPEIVAA